MSKNRKFFMPCDEANQVCDKSQYEEASFWEKIKLNVHLIYCKFCRKYSKNNAKLTTKIKESKVSCLDKQCKESMKENLNKAINDLSN